MRLQRPINLAPSHHSPPIQGLYLDISIQPHQPPARPHPLPILTILRLPDPIGRRPHQVPSAFIPAPLRLLAPDPLALPHTYLSPIGIPRTTGRLHTHSHT
uniref:Uncharacterized protein n=1 Tax=Bionectria ochroleuca TaxID=29856 RepID=A0A8H7KAS5_BIOOC